MLKKSNIFLLTTLVLLMTSCTSYNDKHGINEPGSLDLIICEAPRPQVCTREYNPVCASYKDGTTKTGSTGCTSCSEKDVVGYKKGAC